MWEYLWEYNKVGEWMNMKKRERVLIQRSILLVGGLLVISVFSWFVDVVNTASDSLTGTSCVISAFAG